MRLPLANSMPRSTICSSGAIAKGALVRSTGPSGPGAVGRFDAARRRHRESGSLLIIVLWIAFGLVTLALYFGQTMLFELRAADNRVANIEADQAIAGAACYVSNVLVNAEFPNTLPDFTLYQREGIPIGDATVWLLGRSDLQARPDQPFFDLIDEASKLNVNTATADMLLWLPRMTPELAAAVVDWRDADSNVTQGGAEDDMYELLNPPYRCKNANFESIDELRLVYGMTLDVLYGEDANLNGTLDLNENDADQSFPLDNRDGRLDPGLLEYLTVFTQEPTTRTNGSPRVNVSSTNQQALASLLMEKFSTDQANQILLKLGFSPNSGGTGATGGRGGTNGATGGNGGRGGVTAPSPTFGSILEFYIKSGMTTTDFAQIETDIVASGTNAVGLLNINTASLMALSCIPGIGSNNAPAVVSYRQSNRAALLATPSLTWIVNILSTADATQAGPYITGHSYQFTADIAAVGHFGRGYRRMRFVFDTTQGTPRIIYRQDLTHLGWALGKMSAIPSSFWRKTEND